MNHMHDMVYKSYENAVIDHCIFLQPHSRVSASSTTSFSPSSSSSFATADPMAALANIGLPDALTIGEIKISALIFRQRMPLYLVPAVLHRFLMAQPSARHTSFEAQYHALIVKHHNLHLWRPSEPPKLTLANPIHCEGPGTDLIRTLPDEEILAQKDLGW